MQEIFLLQHLSRFTWVEIANTKTQKVKDFVDECIEIHNLKLVCKKWFSKIKKWFSSEWNISGWNRLPCLKSFHLYDFSSLNIKQNSRLTIAREFLFSWVGTANSDNFSIFQMRSDMSEKRYDSFTARNLNVPNNQKLQFEFYMRGYPNTRGELRDEYDVEIKDTILETYGRGTQCWTKNPKAAPYIELGEFIRLMNYPSNNLKMVNDFPLYWFRVPFALIPHDLKLRYSLFPKYKFYIRNAIITFLCICKYDENFSLPLEILVKIVKSIIKTDVLWDTQFYRIDGQIRKYRYKDLKNDVWRRLLH